jgi:hypothetical protein
MIARGRPKKANNDRKKSTVVVRVSAYEKREFEKAARRAGIGGVSTWLRMLAITRARHKGTMP